MDELLAAIEKFKGSTAELAKQSGVSRQTVRRICNCDDYSPTLDVAEKILSALGKKIRLVRA